MAKPTKFEDLDKEELIRSALEDFAVDLQDDEKKSKRALLAAFVENSIFWDDYVSQHPEVAPEEKPVAVTSNAPSHGVVGEDTEEGFLTPVVEEKEEEVVIHTSAPSPTLSHNDKYLLKMVRDNPLFQTRGYTFTEEHPYALVNAVDAQWILENEEGFRQAFPQELADFYG
jgi:hypothetical protein